MTAVADTYVADRVRDARVVERLGALAPALALMRTHIEEAAKIDPRLNLELADIAAFLNLAGKRLADTVAAVGERIEREHGLDV